MDIFLNFIKEPPGIVLAFIGIALVYLITGLLSLNNEPKRTIIAIIFILVGILYVYFGILVYEMGTVEGIDASRVLAYLGIGVGMVCTAWAEWPKRGHLMWILMIPGLFFQLTGLLLIMEFHGIV